MLDVELHEVCEQLARDAGARKILVCNADGEILAHAGEAGALDDASGDALATLVSDVIAGAAQGQFPAGEDLAATLPAGVQVCAAPIGTQAALIVIFDRATTLERVRVKMRRTRVLIEKGLPSEKGPTAS